MGVQDPSADINILSFDGIKESAGGHVHDMLVLAEEGYLLDEEGGFLLTFVFDEECNFPFLTGISFLKLAVIGPTQ